jgi:hypothetical protein
MAGSGRIDGGAGRGRPAPGLLTGLALAITAAGAVAPLARSAGRPEPGRPGAPPPRPGAGAAPRKPARPLDPGAWGSDHVGRPVPEYTTGDECLFCHRQDIGPRWSGSRHNGTLRAAASAPAPLAALRADPALRRLGEETTLVMGGRRALRFLKPARAYGQLELLTVRWKPDGGGGGRLEATDAPRWDPERFGDACAGCHATAVDRATRAFSALAVDCSACHGLVDPQHSSRPSLVHLSPRGREPARLVIAICASCHLRGGRARSTGLPYPDNFVAGDNLFRDFRFDFSGAAIARLDAADRHVAENVRDVVIRGEGGTTCLSCHQVHQQSSRRHQALSYQPRCATCHHSPQRGLALKSSESHSVTCGY